MNRGIFRLVLVAPIVWLLTSALAFGQFVDSIIQQGSQRDMVGAFRNLGEGLADALENAGVDIALLGDEEQVAALRNEGEEREREGQLQEAVGKYEAAISMLETVRTVTRGRESKQDVLTKNLGAYERIVGLLLRLNRPDDAFAYVERGRARAFLDEMAEAIAGVRKNVSTEVLDEERRLYERLGALRKEAKGNPPEDRKEPLLDEAKQVLHQIQRLKNRLRRENSRYAELKYPQPVALPEVQRSLGKGETLLRYFQGDQELYLFVVRRDGIHALTLPLAEASVAEKVEQLLVPMRRLEESKTWEAKRDALERFDLEAAHRLYEQLVQPAKGYLQGIETLWIAPDAALHYLPFEILVTRIPSPAESGGVFSRYGDAAYLIADYSIAYTPSASALRPEILRRSAAGAGAGNKLLAVAPFSAPTGDARVVLRTAANMSQAPGAWGTSDGSLPQLPYSYDEVRAIAALFPVGGKSIVGEQATAGAVLAEAGSYEFLHLATHGLLDAEYPTHSAVAFYDRLLPTYEVFNLELRSNLVALSACQTGIGKLQRAEGMVGLARAFLYAGTSALLVSLWSVNDQSTSLLMTAFYKDLAKGLSKTDALRRAKLELLRGSTEAGLEDTHDVSRKYAHPFFWGPFVLVGDSH